jgi:hypothetical protein
MFITQNNYHAQKSSLIIDRKLVIIKITLETSHYYWLHLVIIINII